MNSSFHDPAEERLDQVIDHWRNMDVPECPPLKPLLAPAERRLPRRKWPWRWGLVSLGAVILIAIVLSRRGGDVPGPRVPDSLAESGSDKGDVPAPPNAVAGLIGRTEIREVSEAGSDQRALLLSSVARLRDDLDRLERQASLIEIQNQADELLHSVRELVAAVR